MKIAEKSIWKYTIVYYDNAWSRRCAERIRAAIAKKVGVGLQMITDGADERECEILVGKTNRRESAELRARYDRPNVYYDVLVKGNKLVCMGEGFRTLDRVASILETLISEAGEVSLCGNIASGDLRADDDGNMIDRAEGTDVRVFDWNLNAPGNMGANLTENAERAADVILRHLPDVIGTNEMYNSRNCEPYKRFYDAVMRELSPYYTVLESSPYDEGQPTEGLCGDSNRYGIPPENIIFRRELELYPVASGYRYTPNLITYHGYHWAIFKTEAGSFIFSVGHYEESRNDPTCAIAHMETTKFAQQRSGSDELLAEVITGDLFTHYGCKNSGYSAFADAGYIDAQRQAEINCNGDIACSTYHRIGKYHPRWANSIDLVMCKGIIKPLKFKVITSQEALDVSDHCPVCADLKFN